MTASSNGPTYATANPFAPTAVASVAALDTGTVTILTPAILEAFACLDDYLSAAPEAQDTSGAGNVIAVVGDYGTGKTHLAIELLRHARQNTDKNAHVMYIDAQAASFVSLYRRFIEELKEADVVRQAREYYTDVVVEDLNSSELTVQIAEHLRDDRDIDPRGVAERLGLGEATLLQEVQRRLEKVTQNTAFATAFTLMLRPGFQDAVWGWLSGSPPAPILVERGISTAIATEEAALEAMGVFAVLYGHRNHRFVLVIDEVEKVLSGPNRPVGTALAAFKKLLTVFAGSRAFLVLAGVPDFLQALEDDVQQRIGRVVHMSALTADDARQFIIESQRQLFPDAGLEPFTPESVEYLIHLTEGVARKIIRLCYHAYRRATEEDGPVTPAMILDVARTHTNILSTEDVRARVRMILGREGWEHSTNHMLEPSPSARLDEWVYIGDRGGGCGIIVTDPVLDDDDVEQLNQRALAIQSAAPGTRTLLVVNGYVAQDVAARLGEVFNVPPIAYDARSFEDDIIGMVKAVAGSTRHGAEDQTMEAVHDRVERINRQQSNIYRFIEQLAVHIDAMRSSSDRRLDLLQGELVEISQSLIGSFTGEPVRDSESEMPQRLPDEVIRLFSDALDSLADVGRVDGVLRHAFAVGSGTSSQVSATSMEIRAALRSQRAVNSLGVAVLLQKLVEAFRVGVSEWYRSYARDLHGQLLSSHKEQLQELCRTYDAIYEYLPLFQLNGLSDLTTLPAGTDSQEVAQVTRLSRGADVGETLDGLGARVRRTMLNAVTSPGPG
ncbi:MAG: hypothetical protein ACRDTE_01220 [Pseudonocardiaceae bacterium]